MSSIEKKKTGHNPQTLWIPVFLSNCQEAWGPTEFMVVLEERHSLLSCRWPEQRHWQLMLLHGVEVGNSWLKVPLTYLVPAGSDWTSKTWWWLLHSLPVVLSSFQATLRYLPGQTSLLWEQKLLRHFPRPWGEAKTGLLTAFWEKAPAIFD